MEYLQHPKDLIDKLGLGNEFLSILAEIREAEGALKPPLDKLVNRIIVTTLGTGSAVPSKYRNGQSAHPLSSDL